MRNVLLCGALAALVAGPGCRRASSPASSAARPNVLFITIDTLRADRLGAYGTPRP
jgi:hypothetical protein